jgi:hypothetical protein
MAFGSKQGETGQNNSEGEPANPLTVQIGFENFNSVQKGLSN